MAKKKKAPDVYVRDGATRVAHTPAEAVALRFNGWRRQPADDPATAVDGDGDGDTAKTPAKKTTPAKATSEGGK